MKLPDKGLDRARVMETLEAYRAHDMRWRTGNTFAYVYDAGREAEAIGRDAFAAFLGENALDPTVFPSLLRLENEILAIAARHLGGTEATVGSFTSGGTESIMLAVKAARDHARATRPEVTRPELLLPTTAHASFHKSAHYLGLAVRTVPVHADGFRADVGAMADAITDQTVMIVGSAPGYAHGVIDPIEELGRLALDRGLLFHVDACVGGWLLPYFRRLGAPVPAFDFSVPGVTSMSMDWHKYGFGPKGSSCVLYRDASLRQHQMYACSQWTGYTVINPTVQSTRSGGPLAGTWAVLHFLGDEGYLEVARQTLEGTRRLVAGLDALDGLELLARPDFSLAAVRGTPGVSVFHVIDEMRARGWYVQPQLAFDRSPENIHFSIQPGNAHKVDAMLADLAASVDAVRGRPSGRLAEAVGDLFASTDPGELTDELFGRLLGLAGVEGTRLPERMAEINEVLNALPRELSERLLVAFVNGLYAWRAEEGA